MPDPEKPRKVVCESCGTMDTVSFSGGRDVVVTDPTGDEVPGRVNAAGWLEAGAGGAAAVLEFCPACALALQVKEVARG